MLYLFETTGKLPSEQGEINPIDRIFLIHALEARHNKTQRR